MNTKYSIIKFRGGADASLNLYSSLRTDKMGTQSSHPTLFYCLIAQLVEQETVNLLVAGSSPARAAIFSLMK